VQKLQSVIEENLPFTTGIGIAIAIPQSVQTQKVVFNTLVYSVYGYCNSSTMKEVDWSCIIMVVFCCFLVLR
jgi:hypothetical protein